MFQSLRDALNLYATLMVEVIERIWPDAEERQ